MKLDQITALPPMLADIGPRDIRRVFPNPTLVSIAGKIDQPVFISTLLHGNETTSFEILQYLQRTYADTVPNRSMLIFVGNVEAAAKGVRRLDGASDFNRIWAGGTSDLEIMAQQVLRIARDRAPFASVDIHNNTGKNPHYGCVNALRPADLHLASLFAPIGVYYRNPPTTQSIAFSHICPSVTVECGQNGDPEGLEAAINLVEAVLALDAFDSKAPEEDALWLYETIGRVVIDPGYSLSFDNSAADLMLRADLEDKNFAIMPAGEPWGSGALPALQVLGEHGQDMASAFFAEEDGDIVLAQNVVPAMITSDVQVVRQDCLCYLMRMV